MVTICGRSQERLDAAVAEIDGDVRAVTCDVTDEDQVKATVAAAAEPTGSLDVVVASAGGSSTIGPITQVDTQAFRDTMDLNVVGTFLALKHAAPVMIRGGGGSFIGISSIAGSTTHRWFGAYGPSKAGIEALIQMGADELGASNVRVNAIAPGLVATELVAAITDGGPVLDDYLDQMPIARPGTVDDIADAAAYLAGRPVDLGDRPGPARRRRPLAAPGAAVPRLPRAGLRRGRPAGGHAVSAEAAATTSSGCSPTTPSEVGLPFDGPPVVERVSVPVDGERRLSALRWGTGPPEIVLIHGGAQNAHTWDTVALALDRPLLCVDLPGHGHSDWRDDHSYWPPHLADDVATVVRELAPAAELVVGMSLGGLTAICLAAQHPELVRRLAIVDVTPGVDHAKAEPIVTFVSGPETFASFQEILDRTVEFNPTRSVSSLRRGILHNAKENPDGSWTWRWDPMREWNFPEGEMPDFDSLWEKVDADHRPDPLPAGRRRRQRRRRRGPGRAPPPPAHHRGRRRRRRRPLHPRRPTPRAGPPPRQFQPS